MVSDCLKERILKLPQDREEERWPHIYTKLPGSLPDSALEYHSLSGKSQLVLWGVVVVAVLNGEQGRVCASSHLYTIALAICLWSWNSCTTHRLVLLPSDLYRSPQQRTYTLLVSYTLHVRPWGTKSTASDSTCFCHCIHVITPAHVQSGQLRTCRPQEPDHPGKWNGLGKARVRMEQETTLHSYH